MATEKPTLIERLQRLCWRIMKPLGATSGVMLFEQPDPDAPEDRSDLVRVVCAYLPEGETVAEVEQHLLGMALAQHVEPGTIGRVHLMDGTHIQIARRPISTAVEGDADE